MRLFVPESQSTSTALWACMLSYGCLGVGVCAEYLLILCVYCVCVCVCVCVSPEGPSWSECGATAVLQIRAHLLVTESLKPAHLIKHNAHGQIPFTPFTLITQSTGHTHTHMVTHANTHAGTGTHTLADAHANTQSLAKLNRVCQLEWVQRGGLLCVCVCVCVYECVCVCVCVWESMISDNDTEVKMDIC